MYAAAAVIAEELGKKYKYIQTRTSRKTPTWKRQIEESIRANRTDLSRLNEMLRNSMMAEKKRRQTIKKYNISTRNDVLKAMEMLKQQIQAKAQRLRRFDKRAKFFYQNNIFKDNTKRFYQELDSEKVEVTCPPTEQETGKLLE